MKDFNIEQLAKKIPYKIPENTFEEMQENVLNKTVRKKEHQPKIFKINFSMVTSIAAALALIFGFIFLWKTNQTEFSKPSQDSVQSITKVETTQPKPEQNIVKENNSEVAHIQNPEITEQIVNSKNTDENYEQLLNSLTQEELAELSKNTSHDIYLDLYN